MSEENTMVSADGEFRTLSEPGESEIRGDGVVIIKPGTRISRLGLPQVWENRHLLKFFVLRSIRGRYRPTAMGYGWIIFRPFLLCLVYVLVLGYLIGVESDPVPFPLFVFIGVSTYLFFAGTVTEIASSLVSNAGIMSKVYYPRLVAPLTALAVNILDLVASFTIVLLLMLVYGINPGFNILALPLFLAGLAGLSFVIGLILAANSIEKRDIMIALPIVMRVMIYAMPCVYPVSLVPEEFRNIYFLNPIATMIEGVRWSLTKDVLPPTWSLVLALVVMAVGLIYGLTSFTKAERNMVDSL